jgi:hypothetical protein
VALVALIAVSAGSVAADSERVGFRDEELRLKRQVELRFSVVPIRDGIILVPRVARSGVQSIEISRGGVGIDGRLVTGAELRGRLGADAELVATLSYMEAARLGQLFFPLDARPSSEPVPPPAVAEPKTTAPAAEDEGRRYRRHTETRVAIGRSVRVASDERVQSAVVVIGGSADIDGYVGDSVVVVGGSVSLGRDADVRGDVVAVGGGVERQPGARVSGRVSVVAIGLPPFDLDRFYPKLHWPRFESWRPSSVLSLVGTAIRFALFGLAAALILLLTGRGIGRIERTVQHEPWKAGLVGLVAELLILPLVVLTVVILVVSIVGIPLLLLLPFAVLALVVVLFVGFTAVAARIGRTVLGRIGGRGGLSVSALLTGLAVVWGLTFLGRLVMLAGWPVWAVGSLLLGVGFVVEYVAWTVGLGAALLTRFGSLERHPVQAPSPPPINVDAERPFDGSDVV